MKVILWSSSVIPLSLLFNTGPRYKNSQSHRDRWVPTVPKGSELTKKPSMRFAKDGHSFYLAVTGDEDQPIAMIAQVRSLPRYCYLQDAQSGKVYLVKSVRSVEDTTVTIPHQAICIIMEPLPSMERANTKKHSLTVGLKHRGACLFVTSEKLSSTSTTGSQERVSLQPSQARKNETTVLSTVYDCPVRIWEVDNANCVPESEMGMLESRDSMIGCPILECTTLKPDYDLYLETGIYQRHFNPLKELYHANTHTATIDTPRLDKPYARRTLPTNPSLMILNAFMVIFLLFLFLYIIPLIFFAISFARENGHFTALEYAAIVCYSSSFLWMLPGFVFLSPVSAVLVIIDRIHRDEFNAVTIAYIALTFGGLLPMSLYAIVWDLSIRDYAYKAWLATFEENWDSNGSYKTWWWIFDVNQRLMVRVDSAQEWLRRHTRSKSKG